MATLASPPKGGAPAPPIVKSMRDAGVTPQRRFLIAGATGSGKSALMRSLPGRKLVYIFDPNTMASIIGDESFDYAEFLPEWSELDATLKGFNKDPKTGHTYVGDKPGRTVEPTLYNRFIEHIQALTDSKAHEDYQWLCFDSLTFIIKACMDRQLFINNRFGDLEDLGDFRIVGSKLTDVFGKLSSLRINTYLTAHIKDYQNEKTKKITRQMASPGDSRIMLPLGHTDCMVASSDNGKYYLRTVPERGEMQDIRTSLRGLSPLEEVTIKDFNRATDFGIGALLKKGK